MTDTPIETPRKPSVRQLSGPETVFRLPGTQPGSTLIAARESRSSGSLALAPVIEIDKLYPAAQGSRSHLVTALGLLADGIDFLAQARIAAQKGRLIESDRYTQRFQATLPSLFRCRKIGDGFAVVINALHFASINMHGKPLNLDQITTSWRILKELRNGPFVEFEQGLEYVEQLEGCGLEVDPPIVSELLEDLEHEQSLR